VKRLDRKLAVAFLSAGTLAYEILLVRIFAIEHFHHFAYMAISVAMLGFGTSGTFLALAGRLESLTVERWFSWSTHATVISLVASPTLVHLVTLDATQLVWDSSQWLRLAAIYLLLALPFGVGATAILLGLTIERQHPGRIYGANFIGAGLGAALAVGMLAYVFPQRALSVPAVLAAMGAIAATSRSAPRHHASVAWILVALSVFVLITPLWRIEVSPYKGLPQVAAFPDAKRVREHTSPVGWLVATEADAFHFAPGLSLGFQGEFPKQTAIFVDGDLVGATIDQAADSNAARLLDWLPSALPYALGAPNHVLVVAAGGGTEVHSALAHGARLVTAVELHPDLVDLASSPLADDPEQRKVQWVVADARSFVARTSEKFDLIVLPPAGGLGSSAAGVHSLNEDFLHTVDAYSGYLEHLTPHGILAITRWLTLPPRESVRVILTVAEALRGSAPGVVNDKLVVARSWGTATVLARPSGFDEGEVARLRDWAATRLFDLDWHPGMSAPRSRFHLLEDAPLYRAAVAATHGADSLASFTSAYPFDVSPVGDSRPYPHHFLRFESLPKFLTTDRGGLLPYAEWGPIALAATLLQSAALAGLFMLLPAVVTGAKRLGTHWWPTVGYFTAIGVAYLAAEIAAIQQTGLLLGHPIYGVAVVLASFLVCSGIGSIWSDRLSPSRIQPTAGLLVAMLVILGAELLSVVHLLQATSLAIRAAAAAVLLAPLAFLMGLLFPLGLRLFAHADSKRLAWAWAANGFASVVAAPLAALIALEIGSRALFFLGAAAYGVAMVLSWKGLTEPSVVS
jgi:spermidine synthase